MPDIIDRDLLDCLERANPYTEYRIEISEPDVGQVLRRQDQFLQAPALVSQLPANSLAASARGSLILAPSALALATFAGTQGFFDLNTEDPNRRIKGLSWSLDPAFSRVTLKSIQAKVQAVALAGFYFDQDFELQVYQIVRTPGVKVKNVGTPQYQELAFTQYDFAPLLVPAPTVKVTAALWSSNPTRTLNFDLSNYRLTLANIPSRAPAPDQAGILPKYLIVVRLAGRGLGGTGHYRWLTDTATSHAVAGIGTFDRVFWAKDSDDAQWVETVSADVPNGVVVGEWYPASGQGIFLIDLGSLPNALSTGRIEFQRALPSGVTATVELSTAGVNGPWASVKHGDPVTLKQQRYYLRVTLVSDAPHRATPEVVALGIEFRTAQDVSVEGVPTMPNRQISLPWPKASIPEGAIKVVRTGHRDHLDVATQIGSTAPVARLEADIFLASRHPSITRDKWLRTERMLVSNRLPSPTSEDFTLLSYATRLKRKIPQKVETVNSVHTVASSTTGQIIVNGASPLPGTTLGGNEYDGKGYYMRVRSTSASNIPAGYVAVIQGSTDTTKLDFTPALPEALKPGDVIEVHSGVFQTQTVSWTDADPADVWWDVLANLLAIPPERIGHGSLPRGGLPPKVTGIAPGDSATQAKRKITGSVSEETEGDKIIDIVSAIMGGVTIEVRGQLVFVQLIPLLDASGNVTVPLPTPTAVFDRRDFSAPPQTPLGLEQRTTVVTAKYGVPATAAQPDSFPPKATTAVDPDALLWLSQQDLEDFGTTDVPDEIAAWLYNSPSAGGDEGLYLASVVSAQLVRVGSTGLRVFTLAMAEKHPKLLPGDVIGISVDGYTDYDPATSTVIKGPIIIRGVLVGVGNEGRQLALFVPGLRDNVQLVRSGAGTELTGLGNEALYGLIDFKLIKETPTEATYGWARGALVDEVWAGVATIPEPIIDDPWPEAAKNAGPLAAGVNMITLPKPSEGFKTFLQVEPRSAHLAAGEVKRAEINPEASQQPLIELDDAETDTVGTQFIKVTERGLAVLAVEIQTQIGSEPVSGWGIPTRRPGMSSVVRGGILGAGEYEHDVPLDATRLSWIMPRLILANGEPPVVLGPFGFDRDKRPNLLSVQVSGTVLTIIGDSDTKSVEVSNSDGSWIYETDGTNLIVDVSKTGTNGAAGLGSAASDTFTVTARSDPTADVGAGTLTDARNIVIGGATAPPPTATWDTPGVTATAPPIGSLRMDIGLKATGTPAGWSVKVFIVDPPGHVFVDRTAELVPAAGAVPGVTTNYAYDTEYVRTEPGEFAVFRSFTIRADLLDAGDVVKDSRTVYVSWYSGNAV